MHKKTISCLLVLFFYYVNILQAQDGGRHHRRDPLQHETGKIDSAFRKTDSSFRRPDSARRRFMDTSLFADNNVLTGSDYLLRIQNIYQVLNTVPVITGSFDRLEEIATELNESDTALSVIKERLSVNDRSLNLRNLQMFYTLLEAIQQSDRKYAAILNEYDNKLDTLKRNVLNLRKDTTMRSLFRDSVLRQSLSTQLKGLRSKWGLTDTLVRAGTNSINSLKAHASSNSIAATEMLNQTSNLLAKVGPRAFTKERNYLWEPRAGKPSNVPNAASFRKSINNENKAVKYYFQNTRSKRFWLLLTGIVFFFWVFNNYRLLKKVGKQQLLDAFQFKYINPMPIAACLVLMLTLAPLFDLHAPAIYIETTQFLLMLVLTGLFWKRWPQKMF